MDKIYDAFITYRGGSDATEANALNEILKANGLVTAIDSSDFSPAATFLDEMARCVRQSRYTIALISPRYATSRFTQEEAIMQQILDNQEKQLRLIVAYLEDYPAPLWMQSRVGVRLFRDKGDKNQPELKRLIKLLLLKGDSPSKAEELAVEQRIETNYKKLPKQLFELGVYGLAGYGVLSVLADLDLDVAQDATKDIAADTASHVLSEHGHAVTEHATEHLKDNLHHVVSSVGHAIKWILEDLF
jgi:hypothetical protein